MAELLRDHWLGQTVEQELSEVLVKWGEDVTESGQNGINNLSFEDDGSNIRIKSRRPRVAQIIKILPHEHLLQVTLSDSLHRINATISKEAAQRYTEKTRRRFTDGTVGGLIQLQEFEIVATHIGPRSGRLTLFVTNFKPLGSNGSGACGCPQAIEDKIEIRPLIAKLGPCRAKATGSRASSTQNTPNKASLFSSQKNSVSPTQASQPSQMMFATQIPSRKIESNSNQKTNGEIKHLNDNSTISKECGEELQAPALPRPMDVETKSGSTEKEFPQSNPIQKPSANTSRPQPSEREALLGLLKRVQPGSSRQANQAPPALPLPAAVPSHDSHTISITASIPPGPLRCTSASTNQTDQHISPDIQASTPKHEGKNECRDAHPRRTEDNSRPRSSASQPRSRVKKRDIKISRDQEDLLNREDSWLPAQPGQREPSAHLPISILRSLNLKADSQSHRDSSTHGLRSPKPFARHEDNRQDSLAMNDGPDGSVSDPDTPISASEWPPSPSRSQLPSDNSMEDEKPRPSHSLQKQQSSDESVLSQSQISIPSSPLHGSRSAKGSTAASPERKSPSKPSAGVDQVNSPISELPTSPSVSVEYTLEAGEINVESSIANSNNRQGDNASQPSAAGFENSTSTGNEPPFSVSSNSIPSNTDSSDSSRHITAEAKLSQNIDESSAVYSIGSSPTSDLETRIPLPLDTRAITQEFPSTAPQYVEPFTQVSRTPFINGRKNSLSSQRSDSHSSPLHTGSPKLLPDKNLFEEVDHVTQSAGSTMETSSLEARKNKVNGESIDNNALSKSPTKDHATIAKMETCVQEENLDNETLSQQSRHDSFIEELHLNDAPMLEKKDETYDSNSELDALTSDRQEPKRKAIDIDTLSPNVVKRRKRLKAHEPLISYEPFKDRPDPREGARRYRQEFLDSCRMSKVVVPIAETTTASVKQVENAFEVENVPRSDDFSYVGSPDQPVMMDLNETSIPEQFVHTNSDMEPKSDPVHQSDIAHSRRANPIPMMPDSRMRTNDKKRDFIEDEENVACNARSDDALMTASHSPNAHIPQVNEVFRSQSDPSFQNVAENIKSNANSKYLGRPSFLRRSTSNSSKSNSPFDAFQNSPQKLLGRAPSPEIPVLDVLDVLAKKPKAATSVFPIVSTSHSLPQTIFERFKATYLDYSGDQKHFVAICKKIKNLQGNGRMEHPALWDDFIIRHKIEYLWYMRRCEEDVEDPIRYEEFYRSEIERPLYLGGVVNHKNLDEVLSPEDAEKSTLHHGSGAIGQSSRSYAEPIKPAIEQSSLTVPSHVRFSGERQLSAEPLRASETRLKWSDAEVTIDLTKEERLDDIRSPRGPTAARMKPQNSKPFNTSKNRRSLPWMTEPISSQSESSHQERPDMAHQRPAELPKPYVSSKSHSKKLDARKEKAPQEWWQDENTPFNSFMKSYRAIRPGNGNSYAKPRPKGKSARRTDSWKNHAAREKRIEYLKWEI